LTSYIDYLETLSKKQLMVMLARQRQEETQGIALIGMGCRLPGGIDDPRALWAALREGRVVPTDSAGPPTDSLGQPRWNLDAPDLAPMADRLRQGAYLDDVDLFDAAYFGIGDEEALHMDPQQRLLLEVAAQALADANLTRAGLRGRRVGVFAGAGPVEYPAAWLRGGLPAGAMSPYMGTGSAPSAFSGRIALTLGVSGPAITVDTASSTMLAAVHLAAQALRRRECDLALVGTCNLLLSPYSTGILDAAGMLSPTGGSRPFTKDADGHVRGEGCGVVVLKRYADAAADGDLPYAVVRGSAVHQHGDRPSMSVASARGQKTAMEQALRGAGVEPADVAYVECQANGSQLGGVIEAEAVADAYARREADAPPLYLGSCKANLGYLETASGAPGLIKTALCLAHGEIPPQPGHDNPDPAVPWGPLRLATEVRPWPTQGRRLAGVSGVGFSGTNAHVVLEAVPPRPTPAPTAAGPALLVLSAHTEAALAATADRLHAHLRAQGDDWDHATVCRTLAEGRDHRAVRYAAVVGDRETLLAELARAGRGTEARPEGGGVFVELPELAGERLRSALAATRRPGFEALDARIRSRAGMLGLTDADAEDWALAWALGWLDLLAASGLEVTGGTFEGLFRGALVDVVTKRVDADELCAHPQRATADAVTPPSGAWSLGKSGGTYTLHRPGAAEAPAPTPLGLLTADGWLALLADRYRAGADIAFAALSATQDGRRELCRLPGPALVGKRYWPDHHIWR
jgi:3-oxoacyl-[acyl-carrier-protein] synthase II